VSERVENAERRAVAAEAAQAELQAEEAARKQRFGFLHSTFAREKTALQKQVEESREDCRGLKETLEKAQQALAHPPSSYACFGLMRHQLFWKKKVSNRASGMM
jgi:hypothetical protein